MTTTLPAAIANLTKPTRYIPVTETAKMIRTALKQAFPEVKFSVKTSKYAGGSSINVNWTDGPLTKQVEPIAQAFQGGYFDGMTDYKGHHTKALDGEPVSFGGDFVFTQREWSATTKANLLAGLEPLSASDRQELAYKYDVWQHYNPAHDGAERLAHMIFHNRPAPAFDGRTSPLAESINLLDSH